MANTYPLSPAEITQYRDKSPSAVTDQTKAYRNMLGTQAAGVDVGLFYQLNQAAAAQEQDAKANGSLPDGRFPLEANSAYA